MRILVFCRNLVFSQFLDREFGLELIGVLDREFGLEFGLGVWNLNWEFGLGFDRGFGLEFGLGFWIGSLDWRVWIGSLERVWFGGLDWEILLTKPLAK